MPLFWPRSIGQGRPLREAMARQITQMHRALSFDIAGWAPPCDKSVELFSRVSIPPAIVSKDDREWNLVLANIVQG